MGEILASNFGANLLSAGPGAALRWLPAGHLTIKPPLIVKGWWPPAGPLTIKPPLRVKGWWPQNLRSGTPGSSGRNVPELIQPN